MNTLTLARTLNERRHRANPVMTTGEILSSVGSDGMQEALIKHWLIPDTDTGFLMINLNAGKLAEMTEACRCACGKVSCDCAPVDTSAPRQSTSMPGSMRETWSGMGISTSHTSGSTPVSPRPQPASPTTPSAKQSPQIGDDVMVAENGKTFQAKVSTVGQDGRYRLSFGQEKPSMDREYNENEMRLVSQAAPNA